MRIVVFVEGSGESIPSTRENGSLARIWCELLPQALKLPRPAKIVPISKGNITSMSSEAPPQFRKIGLDQLIQKELNLGEFDAAVVVWDLMPPWDPEAQVCRWQETLDLYRCLAASKALPPLWRRRAQARHEELQARSRPGARSVPHRVAKGEVVAVCMEPMFEAILQHESGIFRALGLSQRPKKWPSGWKRSSAPDRLLLRWAVIAAQESKRRGRIVDLIGGDMKTRKNAWGAYFLEQLLSGEREWVVAHPLARRLCEVMGPPPRSAKFPPRIS